MMRLFGNVLGAVLLAFVVVVPANAAIRRDLTRTVHNDTSKFVWTEVSWRYFADGWHLNHAFCMSPHAVIIKHVHYNEAELGPQVRVSGRIKPGGDCTSANDHLVSAWTRLDRDNNHMTADISETSVRFH